MKLKDIPVTAAGPAFIAATDAWVAVLRAHGIDIDDLDADETLRQFAEAVAYDPADYDLEPGPLVN